MLCAVLNCGDKLTELDGKASRHLERDEVLQLGKVGIVESLEELERKGQRVQHNHCQPHTNIFIPHIFISTHLYPHCVRGMPKYTATEMGVVEEHYEYCLLTMSSMMGMICSWRERGKPSASHTVAFSFCTRSLTSMGRPMAREGVKDKSATALTQINYQ